jgi:hypothetical protein
MEVVGVKPGREMPSAQRRTQTDSTAIGKTPTTE